MTATSGTASSGGSAIRSRHRAARSETERGLRHQLAVPLLVLGELVRGATRADSLP